MVSKLLSKQAMFVWLCWVNEKDQEVVGRQAARIETLDKSECTKAFLKPDDQINDSLVKSSQ